MSIRIDKEFESLIPPLSPEEYAQLEENCIREGIRDPLVVWATDHGTQILVDGHNRWKIAAEHGGIPFKTVEMKFKNRDEATVWIINNQLGKRNVNSYNRGVLQLHKKEIIARMAKANQGKRTDLTSVPIGTKVDTLNEMAKGAGVGRRTMARIQTVEEHGTPEIQEKARSGEISINEAYRQTTNVMRPLKKEDIVQRAQEEHEAFTQQKGEKVLSFKEVAVEQQNRRILALELSRNVSKAFNSIQNITLLKAAPADVIPALTEEERHEIKQTLTTCISCLSLLREQIGG